MKRSAGILLAVSSLPSNYGIGCFDACAYQFVDFLRQAGQRYWQILPIGPTGYGDSPYQTFSAFAGNPYFISLDALIEEGLLKKAECDAIDWGADSRYVNYATLYRNRFPLLKRACARSRHRTDPAFEQFCTEQAWLADYALFMAIKDKCGGASWQAWAEPLRRRQPDALSQMRVELAEDIAFYQFLQYTVFRQWAGLRAYANANGVRLIGDIPIYVALDSADAWANPELFQFDAELRPLAVAGCPPDGFSAGGQRWGNPLYDWPQHAASGYGWWIARLAHCAALYDVVRIDHFRGFDAYYAIPYSEETARNGHWERGPGIALFHAAEKALGKQAVIAEDLGFMTDSVRQLVADSGFPNMKVLEFAFDARDGGGGNDYLPHNYGENCVAYTGTHDNQTLASWLETICEEERQAVREYLCDYHSPDEALCAGLIGLILRSCANLCIVPMQDWLGLRDEARMNTPSTLGQNWTWRMTGAQMSDEQARRIERMTARFGR